MEAFETTLRDQIAEVYRDGRWICVATFASVATRIMGQVAETAGFGPRSDGEHRRSSPLIGLAVHDQDSDPNVGFPVLSLDRPSSGDFVVDALRTSSAMVDLPQSILDQLDAWDPDRTARVLVPSLLGDRPVAGRPVFGGRPDSWAVLEDKLAVLDLWADAGIATAPAEVVSLDDPRSLAAAHRRLAGPNGTVWAVDNAQGMHGGAAGTFWVHSTEAVTETAARLGERHDRVRVMPFLDGVPCSVHGVVLDGTTVATRPNEMLVYVDESDHRFHYCRFSNHWDPSPEHRTAMIEAAVDVGDALWDKVRFRGVFSLDGVLTTEGFRPTEVNPRYGMALPFMLPTAGGGTLNMLLLDKAIIAAVVQPDAGRLQSWLTAVLDNHRRGGASFATRHRPGESNSVVMVGDPETGPTLVDNESPLDRDRVMATITWEAVGASHRLSMNFGDAFPVGPPAAPLAWRIARLVDDRWNVGLGDLTPALSLESDR